MKVNYTVKNEMDIKDIKAELKPFGGRCAKIIEGKLEYQIKDSQNGHQFTNTSRTPRPPEITSSYIK